MSDEDDRALMQSVDISRLPRGRLVSGQSPQGDSDRFFAHTLEGLLGEANGDQPFHVGLCGGMTPRGAYKLVGSNPFIDWKRYQLWPIDERNVPDAHPDNNCRMIREAFTCQDIRPEQIHRIKTELGPEKAAVEYEAELRSYFPAGVPKLDALIVSLPMNGHVASLFPHSSALDESGDLAETGRQVIATYVEQLGAMRITMTLPLLRGAQRKVVLVKGADREDLVWKFLYFDPDPREMPLGGLNFTYENTVWAVSGEAAKKVQEQARLYEELRDQAIREGKKQP